jgi:hypothetical protein
MSTTLRLGESRDKFTFFFKCLKEKKEVHVLLA